MCEFDGQPLPGREGQGASCSAPRTHDPILDQKPPLTLFNRRDATPARRSRSVTSLGTPGNRGPACRWMYGSPRARNRTCSMSGASRWVKAGSSSASIQPMSPVINTGTSDAFAALQVASASAWLTPGPAGELGGRRRSQPMQEPPQQLPAGSSSSISAGVAGRTLSVRASQQMCTFPVTARALSQSRAESAGEATARS